MEASKRPKKILLSLLLLILAAGCGTRLKNNQDQFAPKNQSAGQSENTNSNPQNNPPSPNLKSNEATTFSVTQKVGDSKEEAYLVQASTTAMEMLELNHTLDTKDFGSLGKMVMGIDGLKADNKHFWEFLVNGKSSNLGASSYKPQNGDKIEWKLSEIK